MFGFATAARDLSAGANGSSAYSAAHMSTRISTNSRNWTLTHILILRLTRVVLRLMIRFRLGGKGLVDLRWRAKGALAPHGQIGWACGIEVEGVICVAVLVLGFVGGTVELVRRRCGLLGMFDVVGMVEERLGVGFRLLALVVGGRHEGRGLIRREGKGRNLEGQAQDRKKERGREGGSRGTCRRVGYI